MKPLKQPLSYADQIKRLRDVHALVIDDEEEALDILGRVNYYRLSAYGIGLKRADDPEKYIDGISLHHLYRLYRFDVLLRAALVHLIEHIEIELRTQVAYQLAIRYGAEGYRDPSNFCDRSTSRTGSVHADILGKLSDEISRQKNLPYVKHHNQVYGGHFPIWVAVELFSFGMLSSLYSIMKPEDRKAVADRYHVHHRHLESWIMALVEVRNRCAHYGRIYNMPLNQAPYLFKEHRQYRMTQNKIFPVILVMRRMMRNTPEWLEFFATLDALMSVFSEVNPTFMNFPPDWKKVLS